MNLIFWFHIYGYVNLDQKEIEIISPDLEHFEYLPRNAHKSQKSVMNVYFYKSYEDNLFWQSLK